jgi:hypothetical protein
MPFAALMNDNVEVQKIDGANIPGLKASVQGRKIYIDAGKLVLEPGDIVIRKPSIGREEHYRIIDPGFHEAFHSIPRNYQMKVERIEAVSTNDEISEERRAALFKQWEEIGLDIIKGDLTNGGYRYVGGPPATRRLAMIRSRASPTGAALSKLVPRPVGDRAGSSVPLFNQRFPGVASPPDD